MVNGCINGLASLRTYHLECWAHQGAMFLYLSLFGTKDTDVLQFLNFTLFTPASLDMLFLLNVPIAGYNTIGRNNSKADFTRKMEKQTGYLVILPMLISNFHDYFGPVNE